MNKEVQFLGERCLEAVRKLAGKGQEDEAFTFCLDSDQESFDALVQVLIKKGEKDGPVASIVQRAAAKRSFKRIHKGAELLDTFLALQEDESAQALFVNNLSEENRLLLEEVFWSQRSGKQAAWHLLKSAAVPTTRRALWSLGAGAATGTGAALAGASALPATLIGGGTALATDLVLTGLEEDQATRRMGEGLRSLINKPVGWIGKLFTKKED